MKTKRCSKCKRRKDVSKFCKCSANSDGLYSRCNRCLKEHNDLYRKRHKKEKAQYNRIWAKENAKRLSELQSRRAKKQRERINAYKDVPCADCGRRFPPVCMDFDHVRGRKKFNLSGAGTRPWKKVLLEIKKCDVVCACCHRLRTQKRLK